MNNRKKIIANIALCLILVAVTLVVFFVGFSKGHKTRFDYIGLMFVLISEFALFIGFILLSINNAFMNKALIRAGISTTLSGYWILTTLVSLFSKMIFNDNIGGFITTQIIIIGVIAIICISLCVASANSQRSNKKAESLRNWLQDGENIVFSLKNDIKFKSYRDYLEELFETLKYSDKTDTDIILDKEINNEIIQLSNYIKNDEVSETETKQYVDTIISMIKERNMITLQSKRGRV